MKREVKSDYIRYKIKIIAIFGFLLAEHHIVLAENLIDKPKEHEVEKSSAPGKYEFGATRDNQLEITQNSDEHQVLERRSAPLAAKTRLGVMALLEQARRDEETRLAASQQGKQMQQDKDLLDLAQSDTHSSSASTKARSYDPCSRLILAVIADWNNCSQGVESETAQAHEEADVSQRQVHPRNLVSSKKELLRSASNRRQVEKRGQEEVKNLTNRSTKRRFIDDRNSLNCMAYSFIIL